MQTLRMHISAPSLEIPIFIGQQLWGHLREYLQQNFPNHSILVICDSNLYSIYSDTIESELQLLDKFGGIIDFPEGELSKNRDEKARIEDQLLGRKAGRDTILIALGGGVTGDLAGLVAATCYRGIPLIHLPTSLIAQVDSGIGGKVGINHPEGKNLIGAFYQPEAVFVDVDFLRTLSQQEFENGMAEVIKYAVILDNSLWELIEKKADKILDRHYEVLLEMIKRCIQLKVEVVEQDVNESGYRSILNFGHTVGHAIEKLSDFRTKHGFAISYGMKIAARLSQKLVGFPEKHVERLTKTMKLYHLNSESFRHFTTDQIWEAILSDKKARQQTPRFTLLKNSSQPELFYSVAKEDLEHAVDES